MRLEPRVEVWMRTDEGRDRQQGGRERSRSEWCSGSRQVTAMEGRQREVAFRCHTWQGVRELWEERFPMLAC